MISAIRTQNIQDDVRVYKDPLLILCNTFHTDYQDHVLNSWVVKGKTLKECFEETYPSDRSLRYCNGYRIQFKDKDIHEKYKEWKRTGVTIEMYYGNGVVD